MSANGILEKIRTVVNALTLKDMEVNVTGSNFFTARYCFTGQVTTDHYHLPADNVCRLSSFYFQLVSVQTASYWKLVDLGVLVRMQLLEFPWFWQILIISLICPVNPWWQQSPTRMFFQHVQRLNCDRRQPVFLTRRLRSRWLGQHWPYCVRWIRITYKFISPSVSIRFAQSNLATVRSHINLRSELNNGYRVYRFPNQAVWSTEKTNKWNRWLRGCGQRKFWTVIWWRNNLAAENKKSSKIKVTLKLKSVLTLENRLGKSRRVVLRGEGISLASHRK